MPMQKMLSVPCKIKSLGRRRRDTRETISNLKCCTFENVDCLMFFCFCCKVLAFKWHRLGAKDSSVLGMVDTAMWH